VLAQGLAAWHQPEMLMVLDELPRNVGGKIDKRALATLASARASAVSEGVRASHE
jgi:non-ribosomal peptide synthetase component E (peptide arylation enzyme)